MNYDQQPGNNVAAETETVTVSQEVPAEIVVEQVAPATTAKTTTQQAGTSGIASVLGGLLGSIGGLFNDLVSSVDDLTGSKTSGGISLTSDHHVPFVPNQSQLQMGVSMKPRGTTSIAGVTLPNLWRATDAQVSSLIGNNLLGTIGGGVNGSLQEDGSITYGLSTLLSPKGITQFKGTESKNNVF